MRARVQPTIMIYENIVIAFFRFRTVRFDYISTSRLLLRMEKNKNKMYIVILIRVL